MLLWCLCLPLALCAGTVRLTNNSPYELMAVIQGNDGRELARITIQPTKGTVWTDTFGYYGNSGGANSNVNEAYRSQTPYTVLWYCKGGTVYGVNDNVATGAVATSQGSIGPRMCQATKRGSSVVPDQAPDHSDRHFIPDTPPPRDN
jgi:hypothetical protein